eukprot:scaffold100935_cov29-Tisochrysis_lutea.AAC.5
MRRCSCDRCVRDLTYACTRFGGRATRTSHGLKGEWGSRQMCPSQPDAYCVPASDGRYVVCVECVGCVGLSLNVHGRSGRSAHLEHHLGEQRGREDWPCSRVACIHEKRSGRSHDGSE